MSSQLSFCKNATNVSPCKVRRADASAGAAQGASTERCLTAARVDCELGTDRADKRTRDVIQER